MIIIVFKKLFPKKGKGDKVETIAKLKTTKHYVSLKAKEFNRKSQDARIKAAKALKLGNKQLARQFLIRWKSYDTKTQRYYKIMGSIERKMESIEEGKLIEDITNAYEAGKTELERISTNVNPEKAMELSDQSEEFISQIEEAGDLLAGDPEIDLGIDIEDELAKLETEALMEDATGLPSIPSETDLSEMDLVLEDEGEVEVRSKEKIKDEIEKLKKQLDI